MSDFAQSGLIGTLQRLNDAHLAGIEERLLPLVEKRPVGLVLPCHGRDLDQPAFTHLLGELRQASFLREIVFSVNGLEEPQHPALVLRSHSLPQKTTILWNDGPGSPARSVRMGKGTNVRIAFE